MAMSKDKDQKDPIKWVMETDNPEKLDKFNKVYVEYMERGGKGLSVGEYLAMIDLVEGKINKNQFEIKAAWERLKWQLKWGLIFMGAIIIILLIIMLVFAPGSFSALISEAWGNVVDN